MSFNVGDEVEMKDGAKGTIDYLEDGIAYVILRTGVEMEIKEKDLMPVGSHALSIEAMRTGMTIEAIKEQKEIDERHERLAPIIVERMGALMSVAHNAHAKMNAMFGNADNWAFVSDVVRINVLAAVFNIPVEELYTAAETNNLSKIHFRMLYILGKVMTGSN